ncbi:MAG TPA: glycerophosphodiester phosphodiesterase [Candidatus Dormibacteraeota bacterium]
MRPLISAHRGGTPSAGQSAADRYRQAIASGVDYVEFDVRKTGDGVAVICHDDCTRSGRPIRGLGSREVEEELGGEALTLDELLELAAGRVGLHLDLKETGYEAEIVNRVLAVCSLDQFVITSGDESVRAIKVQFPHVRVGLSLGDDLDGASPWARLRGRFGELFPRRRIEAGGADFVAVHHRLAELNVLRYCEKRGVPAWVWTVDDEFALQRFLADRRVAALITNRPEAALRIRSA